MMKRWSKDIQSYLQSLVRIDPSNLRRTWKSSRKREELLFATRVRCPTTSVLVLWAASTMLAPPVLVMTAKLALGEPCPPTVADECSTDECDTNESTYDVVAAIIERLSQVATVSWISEPANRFGSGAFKNSVGTHDSSHREFPSEWISTHEVSTLPSSFAKSNDGCDRDHDVAEWTGI